MEDKMAKGNLASVTDATADAPHGFKADGTPRKRPARAGEKRKQRPTYLVYTVRDADGQLVPGAKLEVTFQSKNSEQAYDVLMSTPNAQVVKIENTKQDE